VTERTREIGIRKTVGARQWDIFVQFLTEAVTLSLLGGALGLALAYTACNIARATTPLRPLVTPEAVALALGVCIGIGLLFGVAPAVRAARWDPIEALRYE
jgi:putative ABC transport system permease protein